VPKHFLKQQTGDESTNPALVDQDFLKVVNVRENQMARMI
jgi:hypothetical protein